MSIQKLCLCLFLIFIASVSSAAPDAALDRRCENYWIEGTRKIVNDQRSNFTEVLRWWQGYEKECGVSGIYQAHLASIWMQLSDIKESKKTLSTMKVISPDYAHVGDFIKFQIDFAEAAQSNKYKVSSDYYELDIRAQELVNKYPNQPIAYGFLGFTKLMLEKYDLAIQYSTKAVKSNSYETWSFWRNLTIAYAEVAKYHEALRAADEAYLRNKLLTSDALYALAVAKSQIGVGQLEEAKTTLFVFSNKFPALKSSEEYRDVVLFYNQQLAKRQNKNIQ